VQQGRHQQEPTFVLKTACVPAIVQKESPSFPRKRWPQAKAGEEVNSIICSGVAASYIGNLTRFEPFHAMEDWLRDFNLRPALGDWGASHASRWMSKNRISPIP
jgi:hypothetical protein